jgi:Putative RNA methylase family UPF0020
MPSYVLLLLASANRVYSGSAVELSCAELQVLSQAALGGRLGGVAPVTICGVDYVRFTLEGAGDTRPSDKDLAFVSNVSCAQALFERCHIGGEELLRPVQLTPLGLFDEDLVTIPKYAGKTNEQFTKLLLNLTLLSGARAGTMLDEKLQVIDPLCGRGTTLNQVLRYGFDAAGMDVDGKDFDAYATYLRTYLQRKKLKHQADVVPVRRDRRLVARRLTVSLAASKERYQRGEMINVDVVNADTVQALEFFHRGSFDAVVADMPYGVVHGSRTATLGLRRSPLDLLREAAPVWAALLRPGGAVGISWNTHVAARDPAAAMLAAAGLDVLDTGPYQHFRHRVDQAITRDILVARKGEK